MKKVSGLRKILTTGTMGLVALVGGFYNSGEADAGIIQWVNRVPASDDNLDNIGSYMNTIKIGDGGTTSYDFGIDDDLETSSVAESKFFVTYINHNPEKVQYEKTQNLNPGESYTAHLSFENNGGFYITLNTIEFLVADGDFTFDLKVDPGSGMGNYDYFDSGNVVIGELESWSKIIGQGDDHINDWFYGELTITNVGEEADFNNDTYVNGSDFLTWQRGYGTASGATHAQGDANGDGTVDSADLDVWETQYGTTIGSVVASRYNGGIPEPDSFLLSLLGGAAFYAGIGRRMNRNNPGKDKRNKRSKR